MSITYAQKNKNAVQTKRESFVSIIDSSSQNESLQRKADMTNNAAQREEAPRPNNTGMPDNLKSGIESLSGFSMDDVRVHYNSSKPATVQALAYTQGTDIHVAPGQEKHLPHEAWHVAQQMAGRVSPTTNINGMPVNDNAALEHEADVMGEKAVQCVRDDACRELVNKNISQGAVQCEFVSRIKAFDEVPFGTCGVGDRLPIIAFEVLVGIGENRGGEIVGNRTGEIENLYTNVIGKYLGPAHIYVGVNQKSYTRPICSKGKTTPQPSAEDAKKLEDVTISTDLKNAVDEIARIQIKPNHQMHIIPFVWIPTYNAEENQKGGYTLPYMEARHLLMSKAHECGASVFRWIDSDVEDDTSIAEVNEKGDGAFDNNLYEGAPPVVFSGFYNWRGGNASDNVDKINMHEAFLRKFFWYRQGCYDGCNPKEYKYDEKYGYIPEPIAYMNKAAHQEAMDKLQKKFEALGYKGVGSCQQNESRTAFDKLSMIFKPTFSVSKPVKEDYHVSISEETLEKLSDVRQSAFDQWNLINLDHQKQSEMKEAVLNASILLNGLLLGYNAKLKKENEGALLSAIFDDIIGNTDKTIKEIEKFLKWKTKFGKVKCIGGCKCVKTSVGGSFLLSYEVYTCPKISNLPLFEFFIF